MSFKNHVDAADYICAHQFEIKDKEMREAIQIVMEELSHIQTEYLKLGAWIGGKAIELKEINKKLSKLIESGNDRR